MNRTQEINFILDSLNGTFPMDISRKYDTSCMDWEFLLNLAKLNNLLLHVSRNIAEKHQNDLPEKMLAIVLDTVVRGQKCQENMRKALLFLKKDFPQDFIMHKTFRIHDRIPHDLDFLVRDFQEAMNSLDQLLGPSQDIDYKESKAVYYTPENIKLHLHGRVSWLGRDFMDHDDLLKFSRVEAFSDVKVPIPDYSLDYLIHLAHMNYEPMHFTLSELAYLFAILEKVDLEYCSNQAKKFSWGRTFRKTHSLLLRFQNYFFSTSQSIDSLDSSFLMPKTFNQLHIIGAFLEKGIILEPILKISKVIKVLKTGDSFSGFYRAPEEKIQGTQK